jgi:hypothetical protein
MAFEKEPFFALEVRINNEVKIVIPRNESGNDKLSYVMQVHQNAYLSFGGSKQYLAHLYPGTHKRST